MGSSNRFGKAAFRCLGIALFLVGIAWLAWSIHYVYLGSRRTHEYAPPIARRIRSEMLREGHGYVFLKSIDENVYLTCGKWDLICSSACIACGAVIFRISYPLGRHREGE
jgi:hypothetical protein